MDYLIILLLIFCVWTCIHILTFSPIRKIWHKKTPTRASPDPFPIIENFLELGNKPHQSLANLSKTYGSLTTLKLGNITTIIISSPNTAKEVLRKNDHVLSNRQILEAARQLNHHKFSVAWLPASAHWRNLRKICNLQMFGMQQRDARQALHLKRVQELIDHVHESCNNGKAVDIGQATFTTSPNFMSKTFFTIDLAHYNSNLSREFRDLVRGMQEETGRPNIADYFPALRFIDPQGVMRRMTIIFKKLIGIVDVIVNQRF